MSKLVDHAIMYAQKLGWAVFPVNKKKRPLTLNGFNDASKDLVEVVNMFAQKDAVAIGVATGKISGIVVLDIDMKGQNLDMTYEELAEKYKIGPDDIVSRTGSGGYHVFYKHPGSIVPNAQRLNNTQGLDVRGDGGYVIIPPSMHVSGKRYEWIRSPFKKQLPECPSYILPENRTYGDKTGTPSEAKEFMEAEKVGEGRRNAMLAAMAGLLRSSGIEDEESLFQVLMPLNIKKCVPPLDEPEVRSIVKNIQRYRTNKTNKPQDMPLDLQDILTLPRNDFGFGTAIAKIWAGKLKYNHTDGKWLMWDKHYWKPDETRRIILIAAETANMFKQAAEKLADDDEKARVRKHATSSQNLSRMKAALEIAGSHESIASVHSDWNAQSNLIATNGHIIDLKTGKTVTPDPEQYISRRAYVDYDPEATCPAFEQFVSDIFEGNFNIINFIQRAIGYSLTAEILEQCLFILVGEGSNGKSTLLDVIYSLEGDYAFSAPFSTFERSPSGNAQTNDLAAFTGKRLVIASEPREGSSLNDARIKTLTGGEPITARYLYQEHFTFFNRAKIWLGVNHLPKVSDDSHGFWRRVRKINFNVKFVGNDEPLGPGVMRKDPDLMSRLLAELPGIFNWAIKGAVAWYAEGLQYPDEVRQATQEYRTANDPLHNFIRDRCTLGPDADIEVSDLYRIYTAYCEEQRLRAYEIVSQTKFTARIKRQPNIVLNEGKLIGITAKIAQSNDFSEVQGIKINVLRKPRTVNDK